MKEKFRSVANANESIKRDVRGLRHQLALWRMLALQHVYGDQGCDCEDIKQYNKDRADLISSGVQIPWNYAPSSPVQEEGLQGQTFSSRSLRDTVNISRYPSWPSRLESQQLDHAFSIDSRGMRGRIQNGKGANKPISSDASGGPSGPLFAKRNESALRSIPHNLCCSSGGYDAVGLSSPILAFNIEGAFVIST